MNNAKLQCFCGKVKGNLEIHSTTKAFHIHCLCCDCQNFAKFLGTDDKILDEYGSSDIFQTHPKYIQISEGNEYLACLKLTNKGILRWYTSCCNTPVVNMMENPKIPFAGLSTKFVKYEENQSSESIFGPVIMKAFGKYSLIDKPKDCFDTFPKSSLPKVLKFMIVGYIKKLYTPSPFFNGDQLICEPKVISNNLNNSLAAENKKT